MGQQTTHGVTRMFIALCTMTVLLSVCYNVTGLFFPQTLEGCVAHTHNFDPKDSRVVSLAARYKSYMDSSSSLVFLVLSPILGSISDVYGRKPVLLFLTFCNALSAVFILLGYLYLSLWCMVVSKLLSFAMLGAFSTSFAYVTDISTNENKAQRFGFIMASFGVGMVIAPFGLSELGTLNLVYPFVLAIGLFVLSILIGIFLLRESLNYDITTGGYVISNKRMPKLSTLLNIWRAIKPVVRADTYKKQRTFLLCHGIMYAMYYIGDSDITTTLVLYVTYRYGWSDTTVSIMMTLQGALLLLTQLVVVPAIASKLGTRIGAQMAVFFGAVGHLIMGLAGKPWLLWIGIVPGSLAPMTYTFLKTHVSNNAKKGEQGAALGALFSIASGAQLVGALIAENSFSYFISPTAIVYIPGISFLIGGFMFTCLLVFAIIVFILHPEKNGVVLGEEINERSKLINDV